MYGIFEFVAVVLAVAGVVFNNYKVRWCFVIWLVSNAITLYYHVDNELGWLAARDVVFCGLAVHGWIVWGRRQAG